MTLGAEIELQLVDAESKDLTPAAPDILDRLRGTTLNVKPELYQAMLEITSGVCRDVDELHADLAGSLRLVRDAAAPLGVLLAFAGTHPFARHSERLVFPDARYTELIDRNQWVLRRFMVFGLHVHVGMRDGDHAMAMINAMLRYHPHLLALSASSPFWQGSDTGLASSRITVFEALPTAGHPCTFDDWQTFELAYDAMLASRAITSIKDIWWDIRPHPDLGTVEVRVCDTPTTLSRVAALTALIQTLFTWFDQRYKDGESFSAPPYWMIRENKWRASRWGIEADIVLDAEGRTAKLKDEIERLLERLVQVSRSLRCDEHLARLGDGLDGGLSYDRQRAVAAESGSLQAVVASLVDELAADVTPLEAHES